MSTIERFLSRVKVNDAGCWEWQKKPDRYGYGRFGHTRRIASRVAYELMVGPISPGLTVDHLCRNRKCVNPTHLETVTNRLNLLRGISFSAVNAKKTHCLNGHLFDDENTYRWRNHRICKKCRRDK